MVPQATRSLRLVIGERLHLPQLHALQSLHRVRPQGDARPDLVQLVCSLEYYDLNTDPTYSNRRRQPADAPANDDGLHEQSLS